MKNIILDGAKMTDRAAAYAHIAYELDFPAYFGNNLDALWDLLSTYGEAEVRLINSASLFNSLGAYGCRMIKCFFDAAATNGRFVFSIC